MPVPEIRGSFLSKFFKHDLGNTANLDIRDQVDQVLRNQQVLFSLLSILLGLVQGRRELGRALSETRLPFRGESVQDGNQLGRALSETRLRFGGESVQGGNSRKGT